MKKTRIKILLLSGTSALLAGGMVLSSVAFATVPGVDELVSLDSSGTQANASSDRVSVSGNGRFVAFSSGASNLVASDTNAAQDIFVRDRTNNTTVRISVSSSGAQANADSGTPQISYDGRFVVFDSTANNLVSGLSGTTSHIFVHDMQTGSTTEADTSSSSTTANSGSDWADISADGRFVVFGSFASNLVSGVDPTGIGQQLFIKDTSTGAIKALSINASGSIANQGITSPPHISCDGNVVTFASASTNLVSGDTNGKEDIFVDRLGWSGDLLTDITTGANNDSSEAEISCNGNDVAYVSQATNIISGVTSGSEVYKYDRLTSENMLVSQSTGGTQGNGEDQNASISDDGRYVAFLSADHNLDSSKTYEGTFGFVFIRDTKNSTTQTIPISLGGHADGWNQLPFISPDGSYVAYQATAEVSGNSNRILVSGDNNGHPDIVISQTGF